MFWKDRRGGAEDGRACKLVFVQEMWSIVVHWRKRHGASAEGAKAPATCPTRVHKPQTSTAGRTSHKVAAAQTGSLLHGTSGASARE